jgi:hypothetical protein
MELRIDLRQPVHETVGSSEPSHRWIVGFAAIDFGRFAERQGRRYSYLGECECPDDCLRDHENE